MDPKTVYLSLPTFRITVVLSVHTIQKWANRVSLKFRRTTEIFVASVNLEQSETRRFCKTIILRRQKSDSAIFNLQVNDKTTGSFTFVPFERMSFKNIHAQYKVSISYGYEI